MQHSRVKPAHQPLHCATDRPRAVVAQRKFIDLAGTSEAMGDLKVCTATATATPRTLVAR